MTKTDRDNEIVKNFFEDWVMESGIGLRHNVVTYYIETHIVQRSKFIFWKEFKEITIVHVLTNKPNVLRGRLGTLLNKYKDILVNNTSMKTKIDDVIITEVESQENIHKGIINKLKSKTFEGSISRNKWNNKSPKQKFSKY